MRVRSVQREMQATESLAFEDARSKSYGRLRPYRPADLSRRCLDLPCRFDLFDATARAAIARQWLRVDLSPRPTTSCRDCPGRTGSRARAISATARRPPAPASISASAKQRSRRRTAAFGAVAFDRHVGRAADRGRRSRARCRWSGATRDVERGPCRATSARSPSALVTSKTNRPPGRRRARRRRNVAASAVVVGEVVQRVVEAAARRRTCGGTAAARRRSRRAPRRRRRRPACRARRPASRAAVDAGRRQPGCVARAARAAASPVPQPRSTNARRRAPARLRARLPARAAVSAHQRERPHASAACQRS